MNCFIEDNDVTPQSLSFRDIGFGQSDVPKKLHAVKLCYSKGEVISLLRDEYDEWMQDQIKDDAISKDPNPRYFYDLGYPDIEKFAGYPCQFCDALKRFFYRELFLKSIASDPATISVKWIINSLDTVDVDGDNVILTGLAFAK